MALGEAKIKAKAEFEKALASTGKSLMRSRLMPLNIGNCEVRSIRFPAADGIAGVAANFVLHVGQLMDGKARLAALPDKI